MMRHLLFSLAGLAMLTGIAVAQDQPPPPPADAAQAGPADAPPPPPPGKEPREGRGPRRDRDADRPPPPPDKAAHFRIEKGDLKLDVKCADDEPMKSCADLAFQMLDRLAPRP